MRQTDFAKVDTDLCRAPSRLLFSQAQEIAHRTAPWATAPFWIAFLTLAGFVIGLLIGQIDRRAAIDFLAPTAAQARDAGWVALSEGRLR